MNPPAVNGPSAAMSPTAAKGFSVALEMFSGPLDLLLYVVRKHELDILDIPIARVTEQYLNYLEVLELFDVDAVGDFLVVAGTLVEIKSFEALPGEAEVEEELDDPRQELVSHLLAYRKYCAGAGLLEQRSRLWQRRYPRLADDLIPRERNVATEPVQGVVLWDFVSAIGRILREKSPMMKHTIVYDETPISVHMQRIYNRLSRELRVEFSSLFQTVTDKSMVIGIFMAVLELVRHEYARVEQPESFGEIIVYFRQSSRPTDFAIFDEAA